MDKSVLCGFIFCHGYKDFSVWQTDAISNEDMKTILTILQKYENEGTSDRDVYCEYVGDCVQDDYHAYPRKEN